MIEALDLPLAIAQGDIDIVSHTEGVLEKLKVIDDELHVMSAICADRARASSLSIQKEIDELDKDEILRRYPLLGVAVSFKDAICVKGVPSSASSAILKGYEPVIDATVVERVIKAGGIVIGKTTQDEFGFGSFSVNVGEGFRIPKNPHDKERCCGGSSGGSGALAAAADFPHIGLGESTGGSIAAPASFCGVFGLTPTYGLVSRYGLIDYGNSLDKIGPMGQTLASVQRTLEVIEGVDKRDVTTLDKLRPRKKKEPKRVGIVQETFGDGTDPQVIEKVRESISTLEAEGIDCAEVSLPVGQKYSLPAYYIIAMCEASTNLSRYCGMRYGRQEDFDKGYDESFTRVRSDFFGSETKRRVILGTFARMAGFRESYYVRALKVRTLIIEEYKRAFKRYDALISPSMPVIPPRFEDIQRLTPLEHFMMDALLVGPNLSGLPHLSVPTKSRFPIGTLLIGNHLDEDLLLTLGEVIS